MAHYIYVISYAYLWDVRARKRRAGVYCSNRMGNLPEDPGLGIGGVGAYPNELFPNNLDVVSAFMAVHVVHSLACSYLTLAVMNAFMIMNIVTIPFGL